MSLQAYQRAAQASEDPKTTEYRLFGEVTRALMTAAEADENDFQARINALDWNRRLWGTLASDCARPDNQLPEVIRARIISLSLWVNKHSSAIMRREETFEPLIDVNRMIMQGLSGAPGAPGAEAA
jgi:flagellar protein FlaF